MDLSKFKLVKNKKRPDWCYKYTLTEEDRRFVIFTIDGGETMHAYVEDRSWSHPHTFYTVKEDMFKTIEECLHFLEENRYVNQ